MTNAITKYSSFELEDLEEADKAVKEVSDGDFLEVPEGSTIIRVLPAIAGKPGSAAFRITAQHFIDPMPGLEKRVSFCCPRIEKVGPCKVCERVDEMNRSGNPIDRDRAYQMSAGLRVYANVLDREDRLQTPKVWGFGKGIWLKLKQLRKSKYGGNFTDPSAAGFDLLIERTGTGKNDTRYEIFPARSNSALADSAAGIDEIMGRAKDLDSFVDTNVPEELLMAFAAVNRATNERGAPRDRQVGAGRGRSAAADAKNGARAKVIDPDTFEEIVEGELE